MKSSRILLALFFFSALINFSPAQTVDEVIDNYANAVGGIEKLNSVKTLRISGKFLSGNFEIPFTQTISVPDKILIEMTMQGLTMKQACDGTTAWMINPFQGSKEPEKMTEEQTKYIKEQADFVGKLVNYKEEGCTVELMGKEDMEGSDVYKIKLTDKDADVTYYYIDASNYILLKESTKRKVKEKEIDAETYYSDYKPVDGILIPMALETKSSLGRGGSQKVQIDSVEFNISVDDSIFKMPEEKK
jgi:outer membrane lipoprotein-sorting protein